MFTEEIGGYRLQFETNSTIFSPGKVDAGTLAMLSVADIQDGDKLLDLGCGYGAVGIFAAHKTAPGNIIMCDILPEAVELSKKNAALNGIMPGKILQSDGFQNIEERDFTWILSNPPYHTDFAVAKSFIEDGFRHLVLGGKMVMVTKRLAWYKNKLTSVFGGVRIKEIDGYFVFTAEKRSLHKPVKEKKEPHLSKKLERAVKNGKNVVKGRPR